MQLKEDSYINIQSWMRTRLQLKGNELLVFAIIHGFSHDRESWFNGSCSYLSEWCGCSRQTIINTLQSLVNKNFIIKNEEFSNGIKLVSYKVNFTGCQNFLQGGVKKFDMGVSKNLTRGCQNFLHNNIDKNNSIKKIDENIDTQISDTSPLLKSSVIEKPKKKKKTEKEKKLDMLYKKCAEYNVSDNVVELLERFITGLLEDKKRVTEEKVDAILMRLVKVTEQQQIKAIKFSLEKAYYDIDPEWLSNSYNKNNGNPAIRTKSTSTQEGREEYFKAYREGKYKTF